MDKPRPSKPIVPKGKELDPTKGYREAVENDTRHRITCEEAGHSTHLFSRFCTRCGWILTDDELG